MANKRRFTLTVGILVALLGVAGCTGRSGDSQHMESSATVHATKTETNPPTPNTSLSESISRARPSVYFDIAYDHDDPKQTLDLYLPAEVPTLTIVWTYGGGWHTGSGKSSAPIAEKLQRLGYACALVTHRLGPENPFPAQAEDVAAAFAWVKTHIAEYGGDAKRVALIGHSSGAHLSLLLACDPKYLQAHHLSPADIYLVVGISTPVDLEPRSDGRGFGDALMGGKGADTFHRDVSLMKDASPINHLHAAMPPTLLMAAEHDFPMLPDDARRFAGLAKELGANVEVEVLPDCDHMSIVRKLLDDDDPGLSRIISFVQSTK